MLTLFGRTSPTAAELQERRRLMLDELLANQLRRTKRRYRISRPLPYWRSNAKRRRENFETFILVLIGLGLFGSCAAVAFGTMAAARSASNSIAFPIDSEIPTPVAR
jgi:hypothetical protein